MTYKRIVVHENLVKKLKMLRVKCYDLRYKTIAEITEFVDVVPSQEISIKKIRKSLMIR